MAGPIAARFLISTAIAGLLGRCAPAVTTTELDLLPACSCSGALDSPEAVAGTVSTLRVVPAPVSGSKLAPRLAEHTVLRTLDQRRASTSLPMSPEFARRRSGMRSSSRVVRERAPVLRMLLRERTKPSWTPLECCPLCCCHLCYRLWRGESGAGQSASKRCTFPAP